MLNDEGGLNRTSFEECVLFELKNFSSRLIAHEMSESLRDRDNRDSTMYLGQKLVIMELQRLEAKLEAIQPSLSSHKEGCSAAENGVKTSDGGGGSESITRIDSPSWLQDLLPAPPRMSSPEGALKHGATQRHSTDQFTTTNLKQEMRELKEAVTAQQTAMIQQNATIANIQEAVNSIHFILCSPSRYPKSDTKSPPFHIPETVASEHFHFAFASHELKPAKEVLVQDSSLENNSPVIMSTSNDQVCLFSAFLLKTRRCPVDVSAYTYTRTLTPSLIHSHIYTRTHTCIH